MKLSLLVFEGSSIGQKSLKDTPVSCQKALHVGMKSFVFVFCANIRSVVSSQQ